MVKRILLGGILIVSLIAEIHYSYAYFIQRETVKNVEFIVGDLTYELSSDAFEENSQVAVPQNATKELYITIQSKNEIDTIYELYYQLEDITKKEQIKVEYWTLPENDLVRDKIGKTEEKQVRIRITNNSEEEVKLSFLITGGTEKQTLVLNENGIAITDELKEVILTYEGSSPTNYFPTKEEDVFTFTGFSGKNNDCYNLFPFYTEGVEIGVNYRLSFLFTYTDLTVASGQNSSFNFQGPEDVTAWSPGFGVWTTSGFTGNGEIQVDKLVKFTEEQLSNKYFSINL